MPPRGGLHRSASALFVPWERADQERVVAAGRLNYPDIFFPSSYTSIRTHALFVAKIPRIFRGEPRAPPYLNGQARATLSPCILGDKQPCAPLWHGLLTVPHDLTAGPALWHGLLTVPLLLTAGLPERHSPEETFGQAPWHGQETVPQRVTIRTGFPGR